MRNFRKKCDREGHRFREYEGMRMPFVFCRRWFCRASAVAAWVPDEMAPMLHNAIPEDRRYPPFELDAQGYIVEAEDVEEPEDIEP